MEQNPTEDSFLKDVAQHEMSVLLDNEIYRHVRFFRPGTNCYSFELITGPGYLLYRGDMGCFEFERMYDMFEFFSSGRGYYAKKGKVIPINLMIHRSIDPVRKVRCKKCNHVFETTSRIRSRCTSCAPSRVLSSKLLDSL